jgi:pyruvate dehydrogenase E2 component (dihydrolipoamide acetyltransferase)
MDVELKMPDLATTGSAIRVVRWLVEVGQPVRRGQPLLEVETDKAAMEVESIASGRLHSVQVQPKDSVTAGRTIATIATEDTVAAAPTAARPPPPAPVRAAPAAGPTRTGGMFARNREAARTPAPGQAAATIPLGPVQRTVAQRMQESKQTVPHFYLQTSVNAEPLLARRRAAAPADIVWDAFFVHAVGRALRTFDRLNCRFEADHLAPAGTDAVGVAVDHAGDLYVAAVPGPAAKSPQQISDEIRGYVERLRAGDPEARRRRPAAITITNLGAANVEAFTAIINPPEAAILAVGKIAPAAVVRDGKVVAQHRATITLSVDHRVVNGRYAADFLSAVVQELETL